MEAITKKTAERVGQVRVMHEVLGLTFREIGAHFGISRSRAHQLYRRAYGLSYQGRNGPRAAPNFVRGDLVRLSAHGRRHFGRDLGIRVVTRNCYGRTVQVACDATASEGSRFAAVLWERVG